MPAPCTDADRDSLTATTYGVISPEGCSRDVIPSADDKPNPFFYGGNMTFDLPAGRAQPHLWRWILALCVAIGASLAACAALAAIGTAVFPSTVGYPHFQFADYAKLTIVGVFFACLAWPLMTLVSSRARGPFLLLTVIVTIVGLAPDAWILYKGQPAEAVLVLVAMHFALALITYPALVFIAPQRPLSPADTADSGSVLARNAR